MSIRLKTGVHFRNKDGTWDDSYLTEQVTLNKDYKELIDKPIHYIEDDVNLTKLDEGIYEVFTDGTVITLSNNSNETVDLPDTSVLFVAKDYQTVKAQLIMNGTSYLIDENTLLTTELEDCKVITSSQVNLKWVDLD